MASREVVHPRDLRREGPARPSKIVCFFVRSVFGLLGAIVYRTKAALNINNASRKPAKEETQIRIRVLASMRHRELLCRNARKDLIARNLPAA